MYESTNLFVIVMSYQHTYPQLSADLSTVLYDLSTSIQIPFKHKTYKCMPLKHSNINQSMYNYMYTLQSNTNQATVLPSVCHTSYYILLKYYNITNVYVTSHNVQKPIKLPYYKVYTILANNNIKPISQYITSVCVIS